MLCHVIHGAEIQSFFPIISKEASQYDNQFQHWNSDFRPHEIGQIPLVGNHFPYNNAFYETNSGALSAEQESQISDNNINTKEHKAKIPEYLPFSTDTNVI